MGAAVGRQRRAAQLRSCSMIRLSIIKLSTISVPAMAIASVIRSFLENIRVSRSANTHVTYSFAMRSYLEMLADRGIKPDASIAELPVETVSWFALYLKDLAPTTERLYLQAVKGLFRYIAAEGLAEINLPRVDLLRQQRGRRPGVRLPQFPSVGIETVLRGVLADGFVRPEGADGTEILRDLRDRAFLVTLADTGLRVHEACALRRGDVDWNEGHAIIIGKGNKQAMVRFSRRSLRALRQYLAARAKMDGVAGKALSALPVFARHDKGAGQRVKPIGTATGRLIVHTRVGEILGADATVNITPHSFRHYFVTTVLRGSGNLKLAQELARHASIQVTQRYAHLSNDELDRGYEAIFGEDGTN